MTGLLPLYHVVMELTQAELDAKIHAYYGSGDEDARLTSRSAGGQVEFMRVRSVIEDRLPARSRVLDVGGATGIHSRWLADAGHHVSLIDPVPSQVELAAEVGTFDAVVGDARSLDVPDHAVDAVLLLGPLYHLADAEDRRLAIHEARRVLRPGGLLFAQGISRLVGFVDGAVHGQPADLTSADLDIVRTGAWINPAEGFPGGHFHTPAELRAEIEQGGFVDVTVRGLEGPNLGALELRRGDRQVLEGAIALVEAAEDRVRHSVDLQDKLAAYSPHLLAIGTLPGT